MQRSSEEILHFKTQIESLLVQESKEETQSGELEKKILEKLAQLQQCQVTVALLQSTKIGIFINNLRKKRLEQQAEDAIGKRCELLMEDWKAKLKEKEGGNSSASSASKTPIKKTFSERSVSASQELQSDSKRCKLPENSSDLTSPVVVAAASNHPSNVPIYEKHTNEVRNKCIEMLFEALKQDGKTNLEHVMNVAVEIEEQLFLHHGKSTDSAYKSSFRSKYLNLKDKSNPELRESILYGAIPTAVFIQMTAQQMASDERRKEMEKMNAQNLLNAQLAKDTQAETDQFKCGKCHQRKCKYYQLQIRSADEPMTTFVTCVNCGNRWKFC